MITLPDNIGPNGAEPYFLDSGGWQVPALGGGDATRVDRLGDRHGISVSLPPMRVHDPKRGIHGRVWISRLKRGMAEGVRIRFPQPGWIPAVPVDGTVRVAQVAQAVLLQIAGAGAPGLVLPEGMFITLIRAVDGRRFLHSLNGDTVVDGNGWATIGVHPRLRYAPQPGDLVLLQTPEIEGRLLGNKQTWTLDLARTRGRSLEIEEHS